MELDPILIVRDVNNREDLVLLRTFDDVRSYLGADREGPKMGVAKLLAKADCPSKARSAVEDFTRWARLTENLVMMVPAEEAYRIEERMR